MSASLLYIAGLNTASPWALTAWTGFCVLLLLTGFGLNLFGFAGNWLMLGVAVLHFLLLDRGLRIGYQPGLLMILLLLALTGEGLEALSGIFGTGKAGGSRRAMLLSVFGGMLGALFGFGAGNLVVPVLGGLAGIFLLGGVGAFVGAVLGEIWKGSERSKIIEVGKGAFWGRILGTLAKTLIGTLMLMLALGGFMV